MNYLSLFLIFFIYSIKKCFGKKRYISIPFKIQQEKEYISEKYNSDIFIQNNFYKNITFGFTIGNPPQEVDGIIMNDNLCFEMKLIKDLNNDQNYIKSTNNIYSPKVSSSVSLSHKELRWSKGQYHTLISDVFNFDKEKNNCNLTLLLKKDEDPNIDINLIKNQKYIIKFGLNLQTGFSGDECPNFMYYIRAKASISKYLTSFIFKNPKEGVLIIGDELYNYDSKIYNESQYVGIYNFNYNSLYYDEEIVMDLVNNRNITLNKSNAFIEYNYGIIIGTNHYKQVIDEIFFNKLISDNMCRSQIIRFNESSEYYLYTCNEKVNLINFPKLIFFLRNYKFNFELDYHDLFIKKFDNQFYFLVLFRVNQEDKNNWVLGEPFYKKYTFSFNLDAKIVGFYKKIFNNNNSQEKNEDDNKEGNKTFLIILFCIIGGILVILLMFLSFYYGMKLKEGRKKRANELKEDNYEYFPESDKENNKLFN